MSDESRARLKEANKQVAEIKGKVEKLEAAVERAGDAAEQAEAELANYTELDKEITKWRVERVKRGASTKELPEKLKAKVDAKRAAEEELEQSIATRAALNDELEQLKARVKPLEHERRKAALAVIHNEGELLAREFAEVSARRSHLYLLIRGLAHMCLDDSWKPEHAGYTASMQSALDDNSDSAFPPQVSPFEDQGKRWRTRWDAILNDPDAVVTTPKVILPNDYILIPPDKWQGPGFPHPVPKGYRLNPED